MFKAAVVTEWITEPDGTKNARLSKDHPVSWSDTTAQPVPNIPTDPNEFTVIVEADEDTLFNIERDPNYEILWSEEIL